MPQSRQETRETEKNSFILIVVRLPYSTLLSTFLFVAAKNKREQGNNLDKNEESDNLEVPQDSSWWDKKKRNWDRYERFNSYPFFFFFFCWPCSITIPFSRGLHFFFFFFF